MGNSDYLYFEIILYKINVGSKMVFKALLEERRAKDEEKGGKEKQQEEDK